MTAAAPATDTGAPTDASPASTTTTTTTEPPAFSADLPQGWHTQLGDEFAGHAATLERFNSVEDLARSFIHARQMKPAFPGADASPQQIADWRALAGAPETPDGYQIDKPEDFPEELDWSDDRVAKFKELAHKYHVHPEFLKEAIALDTGLQSEAVGKAKAAMEQAKAEAREALVKDWGAKFEENSSLVRHLTGRLAESAGLEAHQAQDLANNPAFAKLMLQVNSLISEDSTRASATIRDVRSPRQRANDIMHGKDPEWSERYRNNDAEAVKLVGELITESLQ